MAQATGQLPAYSNKRDPDRGALITIVALMLGLTHSINAFRQRDLRRAALNVWSLPLG